MDRAMLKERAKLSLGKNLFGNTWLMLTLVIFLSSTIAGIATSITGGIAAFVIIGPLNYALAYIFLKLIRVGGKVDINDLFIGFKQDIGQNILIGLLTNIFISLWSLLFIVPGIIKSYEYSMVYYIKVDNPSYDWKQCINASKQITAGHKGELFVLDLSFLGWFFVGSMCMGIGVYWVYPYMYATKAHFYEMIKPAVPYNQFQGNPNQPQGQYDPYQQAPNQPQGQYNPYQQASNQPQGQYNPYQQAPNQPQGQYNPYQQAPNQPQGQYNPYQQAPNQPQGQYNPNQQAPNQPQEQFNPDQQPAQAKKEETRRYYTPQPNEFSDGADEDPTLTVFATPYFEKEDDTPPTKKEEPPVAAQKEEQANPVGEIFDEPTMSGFEY